MSKVKFAGRIHTPIQIYHLHSHPYWEVVCYTQGIGTVEIDGNIVSFETGDIFSFRPAAFIPTTPTTASRIFTTNLRTPPSLTTRGSRFETPTQGISCR